MGSATLVGLTRANTCDTLKAQLFQTKSIAATPSNSCLHPTAFFSAGFMLSASRGFATIIRLALVMAT